MRYYYDCDYDKCLTEDELKAEFAEYSADRLTEAESADDYIYNFLDYSGIEITEKIYNEFDEAKAVRQAIKNHIASDNASWNVVIADDGEIWKLTIEGDPVCSIELANVIPALDYLYSVVSATSSVEDDVNAMCNMKAEWGF